MPQIDRIDVIEMIGQQQKSRVVKGVGKDEEVWFFALTGCDCYFAVVSAIELSIVVDEIFFGVFVLKIFTGVSIVAYCLPARFCFIFRQIIEPVNGELLG